MNGEGKDNTMETKTVSQGLLLPGDAPAAGNGGNTNGSPIAPDNTEKPARRPGEGRKYMSYSQFQKYLMCGEMEQSLWNHRGMEIQAGGSMDITFGFFVVTFRKPNSLSTVHAPRIMTQGERKPLAL